jgi:hypothetical protein
MYKVIIKRYGYPKWDGHQSLQGLVRNAIPGLSDADKIKYTKDNQDFISTIKTLVSTTYVKATDAEAATGLSWTTEMIVTSDVDANAIKDYFSDIVQKRNETLAPNGGLLVEVTIQQI